MAGKQQAMKHEGSVSLFQYWNTLRDGRRAPRRTEIEPADIKSLLADTFILERDSRAEAVFRLAGTRLCAVFGRELKSYSFNSIWAQKDQRVVARLVSGAFLNKSVIVIETTGFSRSGRRTPFELLVLPLDGGTEHPRVLGAFSASEKPFWLGSDPIVTCAVDTLRVVDPEREPDFLTGRHPMQVPPLMPRDENFVASPTRRVRHLLVIEGGRDD